MLESLQNGDLLIDPEGRPYIVLHIGKRIRLEYKQDSSNKYYEMWVRGSSVYKHYGRIGSTGKTDEEKCDNEVKAKKHFDAMMKAKLNKGYKQVAEENTYFLNAPWRNPTAHTLSHSDVSYNVESKKWTIQRRRRNGS